MEDTIKFWERYGNFEDSPALDSIPLFNRERRYELSKLWATRIIERDEQIIEYVEGYISKIKTDVNYFLSDHSRIIEIIKKQLGPCPLDELYNSRTSNGIDYMFGKSNVEDYLNFHVDHLKNKRKLKEQLEFLQEHKIV